MPGFTDLELQDLDLKTYEMDPNSLFDTFSPAEMWQSYNFFTDENVNSCLKDEIKEENIDMECCFSSICPNDLINSINQSDKQNNMNINDEIFSCEYSSLSSSNSSSNSSSPSSFSPNQEDMKPSALNIDTFDFVPCLLQNEQINNNNNNNSGLIAQQQFLGGSSSILSAQNVEQNNLLANFKYENDSPLSLSSNSCSTISSPSQTPPQIVEYQNDKQQKTQTGQIYQIQNLNNQNQQSIKTAGSLNPIIIVEAAATKQSTTIKQSTSTTGAITTQKSKMNKNTILPPSPPSSFGSDSESNQSSASSTPSTVDNKLDTSLTLKKTILPTSGTIVSKSNKQNGLKSTTIIKQIRHQPYSVNKTANQSNQSSKQNSTNKSSSSSSSKNSNSSNNSNNNNNSNNSDDDCFPFLCSLSKLPSSGPLLLTEEEKRTLAQEGHQIPTQLPLSKGEEKILKKIRRKIKNKISAQESRRKKKEYVDSLERRMENYINENSELKKRLEDLEINNKKLLSQLEKLNASLSQSASTTNQSILANLNSNLSTVANANTNITDFNSSPNGSNQSSSSNQFGTLLMVLVLFFAVVFGVWSPVITKDQLTHSAAATAAAVATASANRNPSNSIGSGSSAAAAVAVAAAAASAAASASVASFATIKSEACSAQADEQKTQSLKSIVGMDGVQQQSDDFAGSSPFSSPSIKSRVLLSINDDELMPYDSNSNAGSGGGESNLIQNMNSIARSKTGTAVELTKVRPFIRKLPTIQKSSNLVSKTGANLTIPTVSQTSLNQNNGSPGSSTGSGSLPSDFIILNNSNDDGQIIILNLASNSNSQELPIKNPSSSNVNLSSNYRVINASSGVNQSGVNSSSTNGSAKLPTRFRVINNSSIGSTTYNQHTLNSAVIKLNTA